MKKFIIGFIWEGWKITDDVVKAKDLKTAKEKLRKKWGKKRTTGLKLLKVEE